ncbi:hypothetical protein M948_04270 [Virgibacillus sp. CM-4]|uniref:Uncharacterized protein n=1 Tax=Virgibacillus massiliensis TaxID=1462526 RepID=A0A024Q8T1_9BACI|nr:hypothetical protein M948_04270 [Virgibacillus sp. CM-4]CDQ38692.1 hypothetical protein BN990_00965 [Virgibacillus massiliensis]
MITPFEDDEIQGRWWKGGIAEATEISYFL